MSTYHAKDDWYFTRVSDGSVLIERKSDGETFDAVTLDPGTWASIVASVTARGESRETFDVAEALHQGHGSFAVAEQIADAIHRKNLHHAESDSTASDGQPTAPTRAIEREGAQTDGC